MTHLRVLPLLLVHGSMSMPKSRRSSSSNFPWFLVIYNTRHFSNIQMDGHPLCVVLNHMESFVFCTPKSYGFPTSVHSFIWGPNSIWLPTAIQPQNERRVPLTLKGQCKPHGVGIISGKSSSKLLLHCTKWGF